MRGRFAPSPTGSLHLGNARTALVAWARARASGSSFVMRVEDLDAPRTVPEAVAGNLEELRWLGIDWDEGPDVGGPHSPYRQSERESSYAAALQALRRRGLVYECYLSRRELRELASAPHGASPVYGERERRLNERVAARKRAEGKTPSLRLRTGPREVAFEDVLAGPQRYDAAADVGDIVLRRADGLWAYQLAVVVDDAAMAVEEVVRGDDLLQSTAAQLVLYGALELEPPRFLHVPLLLDEAGERMSKRRGSLTLASLRESGTPSERVVGLLAFTLGLVPELREIPAAELVGTFSAGHLRREPYALRSEDVAWLRV